MEQKTGAVGPLIPEFHTDSAEIKQQGAEITVEMRQII